MRKLFIIFIFIAINLNFSGCQSNTLKTGDKPFVSVIDENYTTTSETGESSDSNKSDILIAYFSRIGNTNFPKDTDAISSASMVIKNDNIYGNTQYVASLIQKKTKGNLFLIETAEKYPDDYDKTVELAKNEKENNVFPKLNSHIEDIDDYNIVFIGFPNWWYDMPMPVYSFLNEYDLSGKTIIPFCTSGGSAFSDSISKIQTIQPNAEVIENGFTVTHSKIENYSQKDIDEWIKSLNLK